MDFEKIKIIIPVLNEEKSILKVINDIPDKLRDNVIVVDNGSTDSTVKILRKNHINVIIEPKKGYGQACLTGIDYVKKNYPDTEILVFLDGDYSDYPEEINLLLNPIINENYDLVIGARKDKYAIPIQARFGNWLATKLIKILYKYQYSDLGPFRAIKFQKLLNLKMSDRNFGWTVEMQIKAIKNNLKIKEVPVSYRKRIGKSKISGTIKGTFLAGFKIIFTILKLKIF